MIYTKFDTGSTFIVGNVFVDYQDIVPAMLDMNHKLNNITLVDRSEFVENIGNFVDWLSWKKTATHLLYNLRFIDIIIYLVV